MHKAAVFAFATAVAAVAVALMLQLLPDSAELTYGEPLPYLKATREGDRLKIWLEDFAGLRPERVWLYVNGELKASGGPGTSVYARCGDRVAALAQYEAGVKRVEAEIQCTKPIKAPEGRTKIYNFDYMLSEVLNNMFGGVEDTDVPVKYKGECNVWYTVWNPEKYNITAYVYAEAAAPDVLVCADGYCQKSRLISWGSVGNNHDYRPSGFVEVYALKVADAPYSQYMGGGGKMVYVEYILDWEWPDDYTTVIRLEARVDGATVARCEYVLSSSSYAKEERRTWTEWKEPNFTATYGTYIKTPDGRVLKGFLYLYSRTDGSWSFKMYTVETNLTDLPEAARAISLPVGSRYGAFIFQIDFAVATNEYFSNGPLKQFYNYLEKDETARGVIADGLYGAKPYSEYNVPRFGVNRTEVYRYNVTLVKADARSGRSYAVSLFRVLRPPAVGAVLAAAPINYTMPPELFPPANAASAQTQTPSDSTIITYRP